jgi:protein gp37
MQNSNISWTDHTFNPWIGCKKVSPACDHCYAEAWAERFGDGHLWNGARRITVPANWRKPIKWNKQAQESGVRARVFCASLADVFDNQVPEEWRADLWNLIESTPFLDWLLLTKRPQNIQKMLPANWGDGWANVWLGTTVENQAEAERRIPVLQGVPARLRFLSCEPLLGPLDLLSNGLMTGIGWVIAGGESGAYARPMHPEWVRSLQRQCFKASTPFHFKQWGAWQSELDRDRDDPDWRGKYDRVITKPDQYRILNIDGGCGFHGDQVHLMRRVAKEHDAPFLDGVAWQEFPHV